MRTLFFTALTGALLGFFLSKIGFSSWDQVHGMFVFTDFRLLSAFVLAAVILMIAWRLITKTTGAQWKPRRVHPGTVVGGIVFGVGWAIAGACPSIALVQLGEGQLAAGLTLSGIFLGNWLYSLIHERFFRWSAQGCSDD